MTDTEREREREKQRERGTYLHSQQCGSLLSVSVCYPISQSEAPWSPLSLLLSPLSCSPAAALSGSLQLCVVCGKFKIPRIFSKFIVSSRF